MDVRTSTEEETAVSKPVMLFGTDIREIPCFRKSFICGICTGMFGGLACFLGTSKVLFSTHIAFASIWAGVFAYWIPCRIKFETAHLQLEAIRAQVNAKHVKMVKVTSDQGDNSDEEVKSK